VDFISACDTPYAHELNIWYHTLNCGYRARISGETDFPCITDERVGGGRSYVHLAEALTYDRWCEGLRRGRCYVSDGFAHLMDFAANGVAVGTGRDVALDAPAQVVVTADCACLLPERGGAPPDPMRRPYWTPEYARIAGTRDVMVEAVVNGEPFARQRITADGLPHGVRFELGIARSSWIALRIAGSAHTNPIFVTVGGRPVRGSRRSADWCLKAVDQCWAQKGPRIRTRERDAARAAYDHARARYRAIRAESDVD
jgi:hypothetical protein